MFVVMWVRMFPLIMWLMDTWVSCVDVYIDTNVTGYVCADDDVNLDVYVGMNVNVYVSVNADVRVYVDAGGI